LKKTMEVIKDFGLFIISIIPIKNSITCSTIHNVIKDPGGSMS
jgi:hypothetical protein